MLSSAETKIEPPHEKTNNLHIHMRKQRRRSAAYTYEKTKTQISFAVGNREADQRLCFRYSDSTIPLLLKSEILRF